MVDDLAERYRLAGWWTGRRLIDHFESHVAEGPGELALVCGGETLSRSELWHAAGVAGEELRSIIGGRRRVVVILLPNSAAWVVMFVATLRAGHVPATPPVTTPETHLHHIFGLIEPALVICTDRNGRGSPDGAISRAAAAASVRVAAVDGVRLEGYDPEVCPDRTVSVPEETAHLMFTSSTTGPPKAVSHSEDTLATLNRHFVERFSLGSETPIFMPSPLGHSVGAIHGARLSLLLGAPLILQDHWDASAALDLVARHRAAFTAAATPFLADLADAPWHGAEPKLGPMRSFLCGGAQVPPVLVRRCRTEFPNCEPFRSAPSYR